MGNGVFELLSKFEHDPMVEEFEIMFLLGHVGLYAGNEERIIDMGGRECFRIKIK